METEAESRLFCLWELVECGAFLRLRKTIPTEKRIWHRHKLFQRVNPDTSFGHCPFNAWAVSGKLCELMN